MKKIISIAAFALAGSLVAISPASAAVPTVTVGGSASTGNTAATAFTATVPADNKVDAADAVTFALTGIDAGTVVLVSATNAFLVTALHSAGAPVTAASGVSSLSINTGTGNTATFYAYTKSTSVGTVTVTNGGATFTYYVKGTSATAFDFTVDLATAASTSSSSKATVLVTDVFGNPVAVLPTASAINATLDTVTADASVVGKYTFNAAYGKDVLTAGVQVNVATVDASGAAAPKSKSVFVQVSDLAATNAALVAQVAALNAALTAERAAHASDVINAAASLSAANAKAAADLVSANTASVTAASVAKAAADKALADAKVASDKALADAKVASDAVLAKVVSDAAAAKVVSDKAVANLTATVTSLTENVKTLKAAYNRMAKKFKFATIK